MNLLWELDLQECEILFLCNYRDYNNLHELVPAQIVPQHYYTSNIIHAEDFTNQHSSYGRRKRKSNSMIPVLGEAQLHKGTSQLHECRIIDQSRACKFFCKLTTWASRIADLVSVAPSGETSKKLQENALAASVPKTYQMLLAEMKTGSQTENKGFWETLSNQWFHDEKNGLNVKSVTLYFD